MKRSDILTLNRKCKNKNLITIINFYMECYRNVDLYDAIVSLAAELLVLGGFLKEQSISDDKSNGESPANANEYIREQSGNARPTC